MPKKKTSSGPLAPYNLKRDFTKTAEPSGKTTKAGGSTYLIQKHAARRLHYDFRLEVGGVLKSWAVTRGPSVNPEDKRLAVHVEDHPVDYGSFEGTIPQGQYGGGTVMLWDTGTWEPIGDFESSYKKGHLDFELYGERLKGRWHLVKLGRKAQEGKHENWLLIKGKDRYVNENGDHAIECFKKSVVSNLTMEGIAKEGLAKKKKNPEPLNNKRSNPPPKARKKTASKNTKAAPPSFIAPQLATLTKTPPVGKDWIHEIKFDGYRLQARIHEGEATLTTRSNNDWTRKFSKIAKSVATLELDNALFDGEIVQIGSDGTMSFHGLQNALSTAKQDHFHYYIFDLLFLNGVDFRNKSLSERKDRLQELLKNCPSDIHYSDHFAQEGNDVLSHACHMALEGIVSKRADRPYRSGRDTDWLKSKCSKEQEIVIGGFTEQPKHPGLLGALLMGHYANQKLVFAGRVGTGFTQAEGKSLLKRMKSLSLKKSPFQEISLSSKKDAHWIKPELVAQISFAEWTPDGMMRHPSFQGLREDKPATEVVREKTKSVASPSKNRSPSNAKVSVDNGQTGAKLTHPDKIIYPQDSLTKRDLATYYERVAPLILPYIAKRPISLLRCPNGQGKACFFQRHASTTSSKHIMPVSVPGSGDGQPYMMIVDKDGLMELVQMGALEIHVWGAPANKPTTPDQIVFDLDPAEGLDFQEVKKATFDIKQRLEKVGLTSFVKTTGGKGLHVVVPFKPGPNWKEVKNFSHVFAEVMAKDEPERFTVNNRIAARKGKIFIDYLRNGEGASAVAPYSSRAREGAPIAMPIDWNQLDSLKSGHPWSIRDSAKILKASPWSAFFKIRQKLPL